MTDINIKYRVLYVDEASHSMTVRYYTDNVTEDDLALMRDDANRIIRGGDGKPVRCITDYNISVFETPTPSKEKILDLIMINAPHDFLKMKEDVLNPDVDTTLSSAVNLINQEGVVTKKVLQMVTIDPENMPTLADMYPDIAANTKTVLLQDGTVANIDDLK